MNPDLHLPAARRGLRVLLPDHHARMLSKCRELLACAYADDRRDLTASWNALEAELHDHLAAEEELVLGAFAAAEPSDAEVIRVQHARLRELLTPIGVEVDLHQIRVERLRRLIDGLTAHALFEDATMYPWAQAHLSNVAKHALFVRIGRWFRGP
jgi:hypothetical protein